MSRPARSPAHLVIVLLAGLLAAPGAGAAGTPAPAASAADARPAEAGVERFVRKARPVFGASVEVIARVEGEEAARVALASLEVGLDEVARIELLVDENNEKSGIAALNRGAGDEPVVLEPEVFFLLSEAQRIAKLTKGAFDVTAAAYDAAWPFKARTRADAAPTEASSAAPAEATAVPAGVPAKADLDRSRAVVGFADLILDAASRTARLRSPGARVSITNVARGFALERAAQLLEQRGLKDFIIAAGGDLVVRGQKGARPWMVGVQDPRASGHFAALPAPHHGAGAVMTSGDYEEFFFAGGVRYHSILDPRTGQPATKCRSVTVIAADAITAEALSRAVFVLGPKDGLALVERLKDVQAIVVTADNKVVVTRGLKGVVQSRPPTDGP